MSLRITVAELDLTCEIQVNETTGLFSAEASWRVLNPVIHRPVIAAIGSYDVIIEWQQTGRIINEEIAFIKVEPTSEVSMKWKNHLLTWADPEGVPPARAV